MKLSWRHWLRKLVAGAAKRRGARRRTVGLTLELLEDRTVLSGAAPFVQSINIANPGNPLTNAASVAYTVTFNEAVTGVDPGDFRLAETGTVGATLIQVSPVSPTVYTVTVSGITGEGTLGLNLLDNNSIRDLAGDSLVRPNEPALFTAQPGAYTTGSFPRAVVVQDVNGDHKPDLIVANSASTGVSVLLGNGDGTFQAQTLIDTGSINRSVAVQDLNGDGKPDLIVANYGTNCVGVLFGNGDGTFQGQTTFATGSAPSFVAVRDVNGDSKFDLVIANYQNNSVSVLLGNGDGTFQNHTDFTVGTSPDSVAVADLNNDNHMDLVVANFGSGSVGVLFGNGNGTFQSQITLGAGSGPKSVAVADTNNDNHPDIVVANKGSDANSGGVGVFLANANGTFQKQTSFAAGAFPYSIAAADINGDGQPDLIVPNYGSGNVSVLLGKGNGSFQSHADFSTVLFPSYVAVGDVNGDGRPDLLVANLKSASVSELLNAGNGNFAGQAYTIDNISPFVKSIARSSPLGPGTNLTTVAFTVTFNEPVTGVILSDFTLALGGSANGTLNQVTPTSGAVYTVTVTGITGTGQLGLNFTDNGTIVDAVGNRLVPASGVPSFQILTSYGTGGGPRSEAVTDVNGDGKPDLIVLNYLSSSVSVFLGNGDGTFQNHTDFATPVRPIAVMEADLNGDGHPDLVVTNYLSNSIGVLIGNGDGTFQQQNTFAGNLYPHSLAMADINGDGKIDLVVSNKRTSLTSSLRGNISVLLGNGDGTFQSPTSFAAALYPGALTLADLNGDGIADVLVANRASDSLSMLLGNGNGTFQKQTTLGVGRQPSAVAVADVNGDGEPDIVGLNSLVANLSVFLGSGDGTFQGSTVFDTGVYPVALIVADINGDGKPDLVFSDYEFGIVGALLGNGDGTFQRQITLASVQTPYALAFVDVNGDTRPDLIVTSRFGDNVSVILNAANGSFFGQSYTIVDPAKPTHFSIGATPSSISAGGTVKFTVTALDQFNETSYAYAATVVFASSDSGAFLPANTTLTSGIGIFSATLATSGSQTLSATDNTVSSISGASNAISVTAGQATHLSVTEQPSVQVANLLIFTVTARDRFNNVAGGYNGTVNFTSTDKSISFIPSNVATINNSVGTFFAVLFTAGSQTITATDAFVSSISGNSGTIAVIPGSVSGIFISAPGQASAGSAIAVTVVAKDFYQNVATGYTGTIQLTGSDGAANYPLASSLSSGIGIFSVTLNTPAKQTLTAADTTSAGLSATTAITVLPGAATHFLITLASNTTSGTPVVISVIAEDLFNNIASGYAGTVLLTSSDTKAIILPSVTTLTSGAGLFGTVLKTAGNQTIFATDTVATTLTGASNTVAVSAAAATHFVVSPVLTSFPGMAAAYPATPNVATSFASTGVPFAFTVAAMDDNGNINRNYAGTATFTSSDTANGVVLPPKTILNSGTSVFSATLLSPGNQTITATDAASELSGTTSGITVRGLVVTSFVPTPSGFTVTFDKPFNASVISLYTSTSLPDDVMLATAGSQVSIHGSMLITSPTSFTFVKGNSITAAGTFNPGLSLLAAGNYTVTLRRFSAAAGNGFADALGSSLDGKANGSTGTNYQIAFSVSAPPVAVGVPSFARGPSNTDAIFLPSTIGNGGSFTLSYTNLKTNSTGTATIIFSTSQAVLQANIQTALTSGGLSAQVGVGSGNVPNSSVAVVNDVASGANVQITFQGDLATATSQLLGSTTAGVIISAADVNVANNVPGSGIPITISNGQGVTSGNFTLQYNPNLLSISGVVSKLTVVGAALSLVSNNTATGTLVLSLSSPTRLLVAASTAVTLGSLIATVPMSATASYGAKQLLHFSSVELNGAGGAIAVASADSLQVAAYLGDVTNSGGPLDNADATAVLIAASGVANAAAQTIPGFSAFPELDPLIIGDVSLQGSVNFTNATILAQVASGATRPTIPYSPIGLPLTISGPDPMLNIAGDLAAFPGVTLAVPVNIDTARPPGSTGMNNAVLALSYDPRVFDVSAADIALGSVPEAGAGWQLRAEVNSQLGLIGIELESSTPIHSEVGGSLVIVSMHLRDGVPGGVTEGLRIVPYAAPLNGSRVYQTGLSDPRGALVTHEGPGAQYWTILSENAGSFVGSPSPVFDFEISTTKENTQDLPPPAFLERVFADAGQMPPSWLVPLPWRSLPPENEQQRDNSHADFSSLIFTTAGDLPVEQESSALAEIECSPDLAEDFAQSPKSLQSAKSKPYFP